MKIPQASPPFEQLLRKLKNPSRILEQVRADRAINHYLHWDQLRRYPPPPGLTPEDRWLATKFQRLGILKPVPLRDKQGQPFQFCVPEMVLEELHRIDLSAGGSIGVPEPITNPQTRDQYLVRSLIEEAITSSQLEGAATTREVAKEMIRTGRPPRDIDEQMIMNNYITMRRITELREQALSPKMVFEVHRLVTESTLLDSSAAGRFRNEKEERVVGGNFGEIYHQPPKPDELPARLEAMCEFGNGKMSDFFIHPVIRAVVLHFWLAYDHPFVDGNGRTARALFYWAMLHAGYWLFEFISISSILRKAPAKYARSFLYTETDDNDLTYFIVAQAKVMRQAIQELHAYIDRKTAEVRELESHLRALKLFNHRQAELIRHALKHPFQRYTVESHRKSHNIVYQTARVDLLNLHSREILEVNKRGKTMEFSVPRDLAKRLRKMENEATR